MTKTPAKSHKTAPKSAGKKTPAKKTPSKKAPVKAAAKKAPAAPAGKKVPAKASRSAPAKPGKTRTPAPKASTSAKGGTAQKVTDRKVAPATAPRKAPGAGAKPAARGAVGRPTVRAAQLEARARPPGKAATPAGRPAGRTASGMPASASKVAAPMRPATVPAAVSASSASRFADRFSPAKPIPRAMAYSDVEVLRPTVKADPRLVNAWKNKTGRDLTDEELLAMPDGEYMNEKQLEFFRSRLQRLKDDLLSNAGETTEHLREDTSIVPDPADRATIEEEHALELRTRDRERKLLKKITQSLARIDSGEYGFCDETGEPIGLARLLARPTATLSLEAQQRREMKQKMFGD